MTVSSTIVSTASLPATIETRRSWIVCLTALGIAAVSFAAPAITVVGLKSIAADLGGERSVPALAYSLAWLGSSFGGIPMGRAAERFGIRFTVIFGAAMIAVGLVVAQSGGQFGLLVGYGLFVGFLGNSGINAPLYVYVSRWFDRRRGTALALIGSGSSVSAAIWAPIFAVAEAHVGWRYTLLGFAALELVLILPAAALVFKTGAGGRQRGGRPARSAARSPGAGAQAGDRAQRIVRGRLSVLRADGNAARPSRRVLQRCRHSDLTGRDDAFGAARLRLRQSPVLGLSRRPDRRLADHPCRLGVSDHRDDRLSADAERSRALRRLGVVRPRLQRHHPGLCA